MKLNNSQTKPTDTSFTMNCIGLALLLAIALAACGGSGGSGGVDPNPEPTVETGSLSPFPVEGLSFRTPTESGTTNGAGEFRYQSGETVEFFLGDTAIGSANGSDDVSILSVQSAEPLDDVEVIVAALRDLDSAFLSAANMLRIIYSLDGDNDLNNGITIEADTRTLFDGVTLDFSEDPNIFAYSDSVQSLFDDAGRTLSPLVGVLSHYYEAASLSIQERGVSLIRAESTELIEADGDVLTTRDNTQYHYDPLGNLLLVESFDAMGQLVGSYAVDYDAGGLAVRQSSDFDGDGNAESESSFQRNIAGDVIEVTVLSGASLSDRSVSQIQYDDVGQAIEAKQDADGDGLIETVVVTGFAPSGVIVSISVDVVGAAPSVLEISYVYDDNGRLVERSFTGSGIDPFANLDATPPEVGVDVADFFYPRLAYGGVAAPPASIDPSVQTFRHTRFIRAADGRVTERRTDLDGDGIEDETVRFTFAEDRLAAWGYDSDGDGEAESTASYSYDEEGVLQTVSEDIFTPDGIASSTRTIELDTEGRRSKIRTDSNALGPASGELTFSYSDSGRASTLDRDEDSNVVLRTEWDNSAHLDSSRLFCLELPAECAKTGYAPFIE